MPTIEDQQQWIDLADAKGNDKAGLCTLYGTSDNGDELTIVVASAELHDRLMRHRLPIRSLGVNDGGRPYIAREWCKKRRRKFPIPGRFFGYSTGLDSHAKLWNFIDETLAELEERERETISWH